MTDTKVFAVARPLFWRKGTDHPQDVGAQWIAFGLGGRYSYNCDAHGVHLWWPEDEFTFTTYPDVAAARAAAEHHWQAEFAKRIDDRPYGMPRDMYERGFVPPHVTEAIAAARIEEPAPAPKPDPRDALIAELVEALQEVRDRAFDHYRARNGRMCSIEGDDGEKCWIIPFDAMESFDHALTRAREHGRAE